MPDPDTTPAAAPDDVHVCKSGASVYYCPTAGETESDCHGGFDVCCDRPDLHQPVRLCDRCGHAADEHSIYGCHDECGCPERPDLTPAACVWPDCLTDPQKTQLANQVTASMHGESIPPMPDQRGICGCTEAPPADQDRGGQ